VALQIGHVITCRWPNGYRDVLMTNLPYCGSKRPGTGGPLSRGQLVFGYSTPLGCVPLPAAEL